MKEQIIDAEVKTTNRKIYSTNAIGAGYNRIASAAAGASLKVPRPFLITSWG